MELATLITETVKLSDDAHRANNAGHPDDAKTSLAVLYVTLTQQHDVFKAEVNMEPVPSPPVDPPATPAPDGD